MKKRDENRGKKLRRLCLACAAVLLLFCAGCAPSEAEEIVEIGVGEIQVAREGPGGGAERGAGGFAMPSDGRVQGARQAAYAQIGEVEKIVGNEVTFLLQRQSGGTYEPTGERAAYLIPVGMQLSSGDYSSLSAGMLLGFSVEGDMIRDAALLRG